MQTPLSLEPETLPSRVPARSSRIYTEWNTSIDGIPLNLEWHALFEQYVRETAAISLPWLLPLLDSAGAKVLASLHSFSFELPDAPGLWIDVPEMASRLLLLPWAEAHETAH